MDDRRRPHSATRDSWRTRIFDWISRRDGGRPRAGSRHEAFARAAAPPPQASAAWLHVVSGPGGRHVARAAVELCAGWIEGGDRVLLIDGGPRLRLHAALGAEPQLGLAQCLEGELPLLGVVQCVGVEGFYVLVHGGPVSGRAWAGLGRLLEAARQHFDRVVLALDLGAPFEVGRTLAGRFFEAWWSSPDPERRASAQVLGERVGTRFRGLRLQSPSTALLEILQRAARARPVAAALAPAAAAVPEGAPVPVVAPAPKGPLVLDCDLQVRERLRFLVWMRDLRREKRSGTSFPIPGRRLEEPEIVTTG